MAAVAAGYREDRADRERVLRASGYSDAHVARVLADFDARHMLTPAVTAAPMPARRVARRGAVLMQMAARARAAVAALVTGAMTL